MHIVLLSTAQHTGICPIICSIPWPLTLQLILHIMYVVAMGGLLPTHQWNLHVFLTPRLTEKYSIHEFSIYLLHGAQSLKRLLHFLPRYSAVLYVLAHG